jgi:hypothetical protein
MSENKKRASKYDKKLKINTDFHSAMNVLMSKAIEMPNTVTISDFQEYEIKGVSKKSVVFKKMRTNRALPQMPTFRVIVKNGFNHTEGPFKRKMDTIISSSTIFELNIEVVALTEEESLWVKVECDVLDLPVVIEYEAF